MTPFVVLDIDGVLADFSLAFTGLMAAEGKIDKPVPCVEQTTWYFRDSLPVTRKDEDAAWRKVDASQRFWFDLEPLATEEEVATINALTRKYRLVYMTGRVDANNRTFAQTKGWIKKHGLPSAEVVMQGDKVKGCGMLGGPVAAIIDDKPELIERLGAEGYPITACARPYNEPLEPRATLGEWLGRL